MYQHAIIGLEGLTLTDQEKDWLQNHTPKGVILFARNVQSPEQTKVLLEDVRKHAGKGIWAAIDEEGGRVHRMPWVPFNKRTQAADFGALYKKDADEAIKQVFKDSYQAGTALKELGFTHNCAPVLDIFYPQGDPIIGNRAYAKDADSIATLATACMFGLHDAGIDAIGKHFPGHGRADTDSHLAMPEVDADLNTILKEADAFPQLFQKGLKHIMTAHVAYPNINKDVATFSKYWLQDVLQNDMAFKGDIWSDDLCMKGCGMPVPEAAEKAMDAGCTVLLVCEPDGVQEFMQAFTS
ncbi:beta-N-acetylhexosaminidase [Ghiorsea bivora]|uniref:beta-N-acetylhexosaminidase n=1 Tax=Ghiorsea bivora TaxID=1485545 RepID=UPI000570AFDC|nr:beta-N-acetylhexosaminidase [Ghiorsea bivora]